MKSTWPKEGGKPTVGVLALQGAFAKHIQILASLNVHPILIRHPEQLGVCDALIIPGGESSTIRRQIDRMHFESPLHTFGNQKPIFGTCAGVILMASEETSQTVQPFSFVDISVERNGYGRQIDSFCADVTFNKETIKSTFIRAPIIRRIGSTVSVLATYNNEPVLVQQGKHLCSTFHPELTSNALIHKYFISLI